MATPPARQYRFPALPEAEEKDDRVVATRCISRQSCGTCSASAIASCVALCCCPCAVLSCLTLAVVKAPYAAGRRCVARLARRRLRKARACRRVRDIDDEHHHQQVGRRWSKDDWGDMACAAAVDAEVREKVSSRSDASEVWEEMFQFGLWGFGRLSLSAPPMAGGGGDSEKDGDGAPE